MKKKEEDCRSNPTRSPTDHESHSHHSSSPPPFFHQIPNQSTSPTDLQFGVSAATTEDHHLKHEQIEEEEGNNKGFNQNLLRLGRPIPTSSPTDQESSIIMLSDSAVLSTSPTDYTSPTDLQFGVSPATTEDHHLKHEQIEEEEGNNKGFNQNLRSIPTPSPTDQESSIIMPSDSDLSTSPTDLQFGVSPATTEDHLKLEQIEEEGNNKGFNQNLCGSRKRKKMIGSISIKEELSRKRNKMIGSSSIKEEEVSDDEGSVSDRSSLALSASPENADPSARTTIQSPKNSTWIHGELSGATLDVNDDKSKRFAEDLRRGKVVFRLDLMATIRFKVSTWDSKRHRMHASCLAEVGQDGLILATSKDKRCSVYFS